MIRAHALLMALLLTACDSAERDRAEADSALPEEAMGVTSQSLGATGLGVNPGEIRPVMTTSNPAGGTMVVPSDLCLDVSGGSPGDGTPVILWPCTGASNQQWTSHFDGTITGIGGKCLSFASDTPANDSPLIISQCNGSLRQKWLFNKNGSIVGLGGNVVAGGTTTRCIDVYGMRYTQGTQLVAYNCNNQVNQRFDYNWNTVPSSPLAYCQKSPFGRQLLLAGDEEIFVAAIAASSSVHSAHTLDLNNEATPRLEKNPGTISTALPQSTHGVAADLNGDGRVEHVQVRALLGSVNVLEFDVISSDADGKPVLQKTRLTNRAKAVAAVAVGNLDDSNNLDDEIVVAFWSTGKIEIELFDSSPTGIISTGRKWLSTANVVAVSIGVGDVDGNGLDDNIAVALSRSFNAQAKTDSIQVELLRNEASSLRLLSSYSMAASGTSRPTNNYVGLAVGNVTGNYRDELVMSFGYAQSSTDTAFDTQRAINIVSYDPVTSSLQPAITRWPFQSLHAYSRGRVAVGDTDNDGKGEIVLAFSGKTSSFTDTSGATFNIATGVNVMTVDADDVNSLRVHNLFGSSCCDFSLAEEMVLDVGDMDRDRFEDIVAGFRDAAGHLQIIQLEDQPQPRSGLLFLNAYLDSSLYPMDITLALGDRNNDSIKARYEALSGNTDRCSTLTEPHLSSAVFSPPSWRKINYSPEQQVAEAFIGQASSSGSESESSVTNSFDTSFTGYLGAETEVSVFGISLFEASVKATGGVEYERSTTNGTGSGQTVTNSLAWSAPDDFAVFDALTSECYTYQLRQGALPLESYVRFCEPKTTAQQAMMIRSWDIQHGPNSGSYTRQWAPVVRDWSNLALFRGASAVQSTVDWGGVASRAVDGNTRGDYSGSSVTHTNNEPSAWWQIDLGSSQDIGMVRLWNRDMEDCGVERCGERLKDFYVFVSNTDFRNISSDPNVLKADSRVKSSFHPGKVGRTKTIQTLQGGLPIQGRYVRVQLRDPGPLSLAEVQVFGDTHVDPHRYPIAVRDTTPNDDVFEVQVYDRVSMTYPWVKVRGNLLWDGASRNVLANRIIGPGGVNLSWALSQERSNWSTAATSMTNSAHTGLDFDVEAGAGVKVQTGYSFEVSWGVTEEKSHTMTTSESLDIGGTAMGFPDKLPDANNFYRPVLWPDQCKYQIRPYYYEMKSVSDDGFEHRFMVVDYTVPLIGLDRTRYLQDCVDGKFTWAP
jgi:hypothetical protein